MEKIRSPESIDRAIVAAVFLLSPAFEPKWFRATHSSARVLFHHREHFVRLHSAVQASICKHAPSLRSIPVNQVVVGIASIMLCRMLVGDQRCLYRSTVCET